MIEAATQTRKQNWVVVMDVHQKICWLMSPSSVVGAVLASKENTTFAATRHSGGLLPKIPPQGEGAGVSC
ncbi:hypothetical protein [uncultured Tateyamaria sp.]|uniref:hypothetical protein n=1 Tax=uncultured Tateyamaria sp. TaxID=455651 RepID=UPI00262CB3AA|nr:hypothetical protein [uncultured Tateyamaria sp.]